MRGNGSINVGDLMLAKVQASNLVWGANLFAFTISQMHLKLAVLQTSMGIAHIRCKV